MKVLVKEKISPHKRKTPEGYLVCTDAVLARTGTQEYYAYELWGDSAGDDIVYVDRPSEEVFDSKTLASFENKPLTIEHPEDEVNPENYRDLAVGFVRDVHKGKDEDGSDVIMGNVIITDSEAIDLVESGEMTQLSCGYDCDIEDDDHPTQRNIRGNHVALCVEGRAGNARIVDSRSRSRNMNRRTSTSYSKKRSYRRFGDAERDDKYTCENTACAGQCTGNAIIYRGYAIFYDNVKDCYFICGNDDTRTNFDTMMEAKKYINKQLATNVRPLPSVHDSDYEQQKRIALGERKNELLKSKNNAKGDKKEKIDESTAHLLEVIDDQIESVEQDMDSDDSDELIEKVRNKKKREKKKVKAYPRGSHKRSSSDFSQYYGRTDNYDNDYYDEDAFESFEF